MPPDREQLTACAFSCQQEHTRVSAQQSACDMFWMVLRVQHRFLTASPPEKVKHFSLDHIIALNLLQDVLQRLCKRTAILFSVCMVQILQAKEWPVRTGCVLFENNKLAKTHFCSHKSMQVCVEEESSFALNNSLYSHLQQAQASKPLCSPALRLAMSHDWTYQAVS